MAIVRPFKGLRPAKDKAEKVSSPPYDVISSSEARKLAIDNPISFLHVIKPEIDLPDNLDIYDEKVYMKGKENLELGCVFRREGWNCPPRAGGKLTSEKHPSSEFKTVYDARDDHFSSSTKRRPCGGRRLRRCRCIRGR